MLEPDRVHTWLELTIWTYKLLSQAFAPEAFEATAVFAALAVRLTTTRVHTAHPALIESTIAQQVPGLQQTK
jgi:hypothetical protein